MPDDFFEGSLDDFWKKVPSLDADFEARRKVLEAENKHWRFVAKLENGKASVGLQEVGANHPFYGLDIAFAKRATLSKGNQCKPVLVGQNIAFDIGFLQQLVNYAGLAAEFEKTFSGSRDYYGNFQPHYIDTLALGRLAFAADPEVTSYKLELVASRLGVELDDAHDAAADVTATLDILGVYTSRLRQTEGTATAML